MKHIVRALMVFAVSCVLGACGARQAEETPLPMDEPAEEPAPTAVEEEEEGPLPPVETGVVEEGDGGVDEGDEALPEE